MRLEEKLFDLHKKARCAAFAHYLRKGFIPPHLTDIVNATSSVQAFLKYNDDQPRVPAGNGRESGQWTSGDGPFLNVTVDDPPIQPVYPVETALLSFLPVGRLLTTWRALTESAGALAIENGAAADAEWTLGNFKSPERWATQIAKRDWTPEDITNTIANGEQYPAPNRVNPRNTATRYQDPSSGRFVVKDDVTNEILQISGPRFIPDTAPNE
jgi:hypothetical protein